MSTVYGHLDSVNFSFYSPEEARKVSVKEISSDLAFDSLQRPINGGLYDPCMGVSPYDHLSRCGTCDNESAECPGHPGHIELAVPVYNPFLFSDLYKLLKASCYHCHRLRIISNK